MDNTELAQKIRWEGGLLEALDYGIRADDIADPDLASFWARLEQAHREFAPLAEEARARLNVPA